MKKINKISKDINSINKLSKWEKGLNKILIDIPKIENLEDIINNHVFLKHEEKITKEKYIENMNNFVDSTLVLYKNTLNSYENNKNINDKKKIEQLNNIIENVINSFQNVRNVIEDLK